MANSNLITLILLSLFSTILASPLSFFTRDIKLTPRQMAATVTCDQYSMWANYSTIGVNTTYRAQYIIASPLGTDPTTAPLDEATKMMKAGNLTNDKELNSRCPNSTAIALAGAEANFTMGIVGPFTIKKKSAAVRIGGGAGSLALVAAIVVTGLIL